MDPLEELSYAEPYFEKRVAELAALLSRANLEAISSAAEQENEESLAAALGIRRDEARSIAQYFQAIASKHPELIQRLADRGSGFTAGT